MFPGRKVKCNHCLGRTPVGQLYENLMSPAIEINASLFLHTHPLSLPARTWTKFEKLLGGVLSSCGPGSGPWLAWLPDPSLVLLAQFIERQPASTTTLQAPVIPCLMTYERTSVKMEKRNCSTTHELWLLKWNCDLYSPMYLMPQCDKAYPLVSCCFHWNFF